MIHISRNDIDTNRMQFDCMKILYKMDYEIYKIIGNIIKDFIRDNLIDFMHGFHIWEK